MRNAARAIPQVWSKTFWNGIVLLANLQAVKDLDPLRLLREIRQLQGELVASEQTIQPEPHRAADEVTTFVRILRTAWRAGEIRPTHRKPVGPPRTWRTRRDPFEEVWPAILERLHGSPDLIAKELFQQLQAENPGVFPDCQLRTLQRRVKEWRSDMARRLIMSAEELLNDTQTALLEAR
jgi:hypothetical protein